MPIHNRHSIRVFITFLCFNWIACSHSVTLPEPTIPNASSQTPTQGALVPENIPSFAENAKDSEIEIEYTLSRDRYRFHALAKTGIVHASTSLNKQIIENGEINPDRYPEFLKKAYDFLQYARSFSMANPSCRSPFSITVRIKKEIKHARGCRSSDEGGRLGHLIRDGEFLLYSAPDGAPSAIRR